jgi:hypothetical protein
MKVLNTGVSSSNLLKNLEEPALFAQKENIISDEKRIESYRIKYRRENKKLMNPSAPSFLIKENAKLLISYGADAFLIELKSLEEMVVFKNKIITRHNGIDAMYRAKIVDWIMEVLKVLGCKEETTFLSVNLIDSYLAHSENTISREDLNLYCMAAMYIASKMEDTMSISVKIIVNQISNKLYTW